MRKTILGLALILAGPAAATQEYILPTLFDVMDVAPGDVLNVRAGPGTGHPVIGTLAPDVAGIEVVAHDATGRWGQVNVEGQAGWVAMRHLAYRTDVWEHGALPANLVCIGTEPFWMFQPEGEEIRFATPERPEGEGARISAILDTGVFRDPRRAVVAVGGEWRLTATVTPARCSDGMSDRVYGLQTIAVREGPEGAELLAGCCRIGD